MFKLWSLTYLPYAIVKLDRCLHAILDKKLDGIFSCLDSWHDSTIILQSSHCFGSSRWHLADVTARHMLAVGVSCCLWQQCITKNSVQKLQQITILHNWGRNNIAMMHNTCPPFQVESCPPPPYCFSRFAPVNCWNGILQLPPLCFSNQYMLVLF